MDVARVPPAMPAMLDFDLLLELYPDHPTRGAFLRRAHDVLRQDRLALQDAMARRDHGDARQLAHRIQGTAAFLNGAREATVELFLSLNLALAQGDPEGAHEPGVPILAYLADLEAALLRAAEDH